jgi:hypothetical protein
MPNRSNLVIPESTYASECLLIWQNRLAALVVQPDGHLLGANDRFGSTADDQKTKICSLPVAAFEQFQVAGLHHSRWWFSMGYAAGLRAANILFYSY